MINSINKTKSKIFKYSGKKILYKKGDNLYKKILLTFTVIIIFTFAASAVCAEDNNTIVSLAEPASNVDSSTFTDLQKEIKSA